MEYRTCRRISTPLSLLGLGGGGHSKLGNNPESAESVIAAARASGINYFDTAEIYGTEKYLGNSLEEAIESSVISTKLWYRNHLGNLKNPDEIRGSLQASLQHLGRKTIDIYFIHGVLPKDYNEVEEKVLPVLLEARTDGIVKAIGVSEMFNQDPEHSMLLRAVSNPEWDAVMAGYNLLNQTAHTRLIPEAASRGMGVITMFAVRNVLSSWENLRKYMNDNSLLDNERQSSMEQLQKLSGRTLPSLAYRFVLDTPGITSVLCGTGNPDHLIENVKECDRLPLRAEELSLISALFSDIPLCTGE